MTAQLINSIAITVLAATIIILTLALHLQTKRITMVQETVNGLTRDILQALITVSQRHPSADEYPDIVDPEDAEAYQLDLDMER